MKKALSTFMLAATLAFGSTFANAGIIILNSSANTSTPQPCSAEVTTDCTPATEFDLTGIIILNVAGIIIL